MLSTTKANYVDTKKSVKVVSRLSRTGRLCYFRIVRNKEGILFIQGINRFIHIIVSVGFEEDAQHNVKR